MLKKITSLTVVLSMLLSYSTPVFAGTLENNGKVSSKNHLKLFESQRFFSEKPSFDIQKASILRSPKPLFQSSQYPQAQAGEMNGSYAQGKNDGKIVGKDSASQLWLVFGLVGGVVGFIPSTFYGLEPPASKLPMNRSEDYRTGFVEGYKSAKRGKQMGYAGIGWVIWIAALVAASSR
jgi:hypothetical protein